MYDENQEIAVRWNNSNRNWYESRGYIFTKRNDKFYVKAKDLSEHSSAKIDVICDYCGRSYKTQYGLINNARKILCKDACYHCCGKKASEASILKRANKYFEIMDKVCAEHNYKLLTTKPEYTDVKMKIKFICPKHGVQEMMLDNFIRGHECIKCSYEKRGKKMRHDINFVKQTISSINNNTLLNPEDYRDSTVRNLKIKCQCGNTYTTSFANFTKVGINRCRKCASAESSGEFKIRNFLEDNCINYIQEKRFKDCRDKKPLPFDFYLPDFNMCIEFDGQQHFEPKFGESSFRQTTKHDKIKSTYCKENNIRLIRIPYYKGREIETILRTEIK